MRLVAVEEADGRGSFIDVPVVRNLAAQVHPRALALVAGPHVWEETVGLDEGQAGGDVIAQGDDDRGPNGLVRRPRRRLVQQRCAATEE